MISNSTANSKLYGIILKSLSGFYYVETAEGLCQCRAKGIFRKNKISPFVGDKVEVELDNQGSYTVSDIYERKNELIRPPLANLDILGIVISTCEPCPNALLIDKFIAVAEYKNIEPIIIITKTDLAVLEDIKNIYEKSGFKVFLIDYNNESLTNLTDYLKNKVTAFCGNSGVGKSTLLNKINPNLALDTGEISQKLGRGKHTTRHVELFKLENSGYIADTPGFSTMEVEKYDVILKEDLQYCFREFEEYINNCKFTGCSHTVEQGCAVLEALKNNKIEKSRHESYLAMYNGAKLIKEWEIK